MLGALSLGLQLSAEVPCQAAGAPLKLLAIKHPFLFVMCRERSCFGGECKIGHR